MKILVTGAAGDFGRDLVPLLAEQHQVRATDLQKIDCPCEFMQADLRDPRACAELVEGMEAVIHLAALLPTGEWSVDEYCQVNSTATALLMDAAAKAGVQVFVYTSTVWVTGHGAEEVPPIDERAPTRPVCVYGLTKLMGELAAEYFARASDMRVVVLRMCGYERCPEIGPDGFIDWARIDWPQLVFYLTRSGQKLFDPLDLLDVYEAALRLEHKFSRFLIGQQWPFSAEDVQTLRQDPTAAWTKYYPMAEQLFAALGVNPPEIEYFYSVSGFAQATQWRQRITLDIVARRYLARYGDRI